MFDKNKPVESTGKTTPGPVVVDTREPVNEATPVPLDRDALVEALFAQHVQKQKATFTFCPEMSRDFWLQLFADEIKFFQEADEAVVRRFIQKVPSTEGYNLWYDHYREIRNFFDTHEEEKRFADLFGQGQWDSCAMGKGLDERASALEQRLVQFDFYRQIPNDAPKAARVMLYLSFHPDYCHWTPSKNLVVSRGSVFARVALRLDSKSGESPAFW
ncbi:MAG TPA: hypothetical protein VMJ93_10830 [Verrucomicrobiae bacterium]|nr:hypothetical protein [Verrucomicrobiae bacterium]